jgi:hypothetical protein
MRKRARGASWQDPSGSRPPRVMPAEPRGWRPHKLVRLIPPRYPYKMLQSQSPSGRQWFAIHLRELTLEVPDEPLTRQLDALANKGVTRGLKSRLSGKSSDRAIECRK